MSTTIRQTLPRETSDSNAEKRIFIPGAPWDLYEAFVDLLSEGSPVRASYDGKDLEIMVTGPLHDDFADLLDAVFQGGCRQPRNSLQASGPDDMEAAQDPQGHRLRPVL